MPINLIKNERFHSLGAKNDGPSLISIKEEALKKIVSYEPILARGGFDIFIEFIQNSDPPKLRWKLDVLQQFDIGELIGISNVLDNRLEEQTRKY